MFCCFWRPLWTKAVQAPRVVSWSAWCLHLFWKWMEEKATYLKFDILWWWWNKVNFVLVPSIINNYIVCLFFAIVIVFWNILSFGCCGTQISRLWDITGLLNLILILYSSINRQHTNIKRLILDLWLIQPAYVRINLVSDWMDAFNGLLCSCRSFRGINVRLRWCIWI